MLVAQMAPPVTSSRTGCTSCMHETSPRISLTADHVLVTVSTATNMMLSSRMTVDVALVPLRSATRSPTSSIDSSAAMAQVGWIVNSNGTKSCSAMAVPMAIDAAQRDSGSLAVFQTGENSCSVRGTTSGADSLIHAEVERLEQGLDADRLRRMTDHADQLSDNGQQRHGVTLTQAADDLWIYSSPELYEMLVVRRQRRADQYGHFVGQALIAALL